MSGKKRLRKFAVRAFKIVATALVAWWLARSLIDSWSEIVKIDWRPRWGWLTSSGAFYLIGFFPSALFWHYILKQLGQTPKLFNAIAAYYVSQLGKYVPGKAMVVVVRAGMIANQGTRASVAAVAVFYETLAMMGSGAFWGAAIILTSFREHSYFSWLAFGAAACSLLPLIPPIFTRVVKFLRVGKDDPAVENALRSASYFHVLVGFVLTSFVWLFFGLSLYCAINGLGLTATSLMDALPRCISVQALAVALGFYVLISPGGLGIREAILSALLAPYLVGLLELPENASFTVDPSALSTIVSLILRIVTIVAELLCFLVLMGVIGVKKLAATPSEEE